jgi:hypothetical protein
MDNRTIYIEIIKFKSVHGSITHYFHFLYGVLIPLILVYNKYSKKYNNIIFLVDYIDIMFKILLQLPFDIKLKDKKYNIKTINKRQIYLKPLDVFPEQSKKQDLLLKSGHAGKITYKKYKIINKFFKASIKNYNLLIPSKKYNVVIIERKTNNSYKTIIEEHILKYDIYKTSGSERRQIINHKEFVNFIKEYYKDYKCINVSLEYLSLFQQYYLFNNADLVIAQHGAGCGNIIFMKQKKFIEINVENGLQLFADIAETCKIDYYNYKTTENNTLIDLDKFKMFLDNNNLVFL